MTLDMEALAAYNMKKQQLLEEYRRFNRLKASDIAELAEMLELMGYPIDKIVVKLFRDLGSEISKVVILKALPEKYLRPRKDNNGDYSTPTITTTTTNNNNNNSIFLTLYESQIAIEDLLALVKDMLKKVRDNPAVLEQLTQDDEVRSCIASINESITSIQSILDEIKNKRDLDMRTYIRELQELCIHLLSLSYSYRRVAKIFGISAKWVSRIIREKSIENIPSVYIRIDRDVKAGEEIDILPYAIGLYKRRKEREGERRTERTTKEVP